MNKPQLVVRKDGQLYTAEFNMDFFKDEIKDGIVYRGSDFRRYLRISNQAVQQDLELMASTALPFMCYQTTEGALEELKSAYVTKRKSIANLHLGILEKAKQVAEQEEVPYFGLVVVAQQGDFPKEPVDADRDTFGLDSILGYKKIEYNQHDRYLKENTFVERDPKPVVWSLHPTVQLYVPRGVNSDAVKKLAEETELAKERSV